MRPERRGGGEGALPSGAAPAAAPVPGHHPHVSAPAGMSRPGPRRRPSPGPRLRDHVLPQPPAPASLPPPPAAPLLLLLLLPPLTPPARTRAASCCWRRSSASTWWRAPPSSRHSGSPGEAEARALGRHTLRNFSAAHGGKPSRLRAFLRRYEAALAAGVRADALRPRSGLPGAFYFVGTVVSTIGELRARRARLSFPRLSAALSTAPGARAAFLSSLFPSNARCLLSSRPLLPARSLSSCLVFFTGFRRGRWPESPIPGAHPKGD